MVFGDHNVLDHCGSVSSYKRPLMQRPHVRHEWLDRYRGTSSGQDLWFSKIQRDLIARGIFTSEKDLAKKIKRYIGKYNDAPKPIRWSYTKVTKRITRSSANTVH